MFRLVKSLLRPIRRIFLYLARRMQLRFDMFVCKRHYPKQLQKCRGKLKRKEKIRVMFLVSELAKWKMQSLYDLMEGSEFFEPFLAISCFGKWWAHPEYETLLNDSIAAFEKKGMRYVVVADFRTKRNVPLRQFEPDIVFYEQPYEWTREYMPVSVSRYALTMYIPYAVPTNEVNPKWYDIPFLRTIYLYILLNNQIVRSLNALADETWFVGKIVGLGHTFYDLYDDNATQNRGPGMNDLVIYAPHWSFDHPRNINTQNLSTFLWNGKAILAFAKGHPEIKWVFKPHPRLQWQLVMSNVWTKDEVDSYYKEWGRIGVSYLGCDYVELFKRSRAMITDCSSFVAEYPPCGGALIHLRSSTEKSKLLHAYCNMYDSFYQVHNLAEMYETFEKVLVRGEDPKRDVRIKAVKELKLVGNNAARNIVNYILKDLR